MNRLLKHHLLLLLVLLVPALLLGSCRRNSSVKPLSQLKREQRSAIDRLIRANNFQVVERSNETLPANPDSRVFYLLSNGLYLRVINPGGDRPVVNQTVVAVSMVGNYFSQDNSRGAVIDNLNQPDRPPLYFRYVSRYTYDGTLHFDQIPEDSSFGAYSGVLCEGLAFPMSVLGDGAEVELIIPFELGPANNYTAGNSLHIQRATYQFYHKPQQ